MGRTELCAWLRANSSGIYRPAAEAADEIEMLAAAKEQHFQQAMLNGARANELRDALKALLCAKWCTPEYEAATAKAVALLVAG